MREREREREVNDNHDYYMALQFFFWVGSSKPQF